jgi:hypothetical protein
VPTTPDSVETPPVVRQVRPRALVLASQSVSPGESPPLPSDAAKPALLFATPTSRAPAHAGAAPPQLASARSSVSDVAVRPRLRLRRAILSSQATESSASSSGEEADDADSDEQSSDSEEGAAVRPPVSESDPEQAEEIASPGGAEGGQSDAKRQARRAKLRQRQRERRKKRRGVSRFLDEEAEEVCGRSVQSCGG